jgi:hypothetical protein
MARLQVYITDHCWTCQETAHIVADVAAAHPEVVCEVLDLAEVEQPENVFAVPTYVLDGRVIFMGNPTREQLSRRLDEL